MSKESKSIAEKYLIFEISGGHGKQIMATAVIRALKKQYPDNLDFAKAGPLLKELLNK